MTRSCGRCGKPHYARGLCRTHYLMAIGRGEIVVGKPGRRVGTSTLSIAVQDRIGLALIAGDSLSAIARAEGVTRDQVRTVRRYLERLNT